MIVRLVAATLLTLPVLAADPPPAPKISLEPPGPVLIGDPVAVRVTGLPPGETVTLTAELTDSAGTRWRSQAEYRASPAGEVDPARQAPQSGTYDGTDPVGHFWSMEEVEGAAPKAPDTAATASDVTLRASVGGKQVAEAVHRRWLVAPGVDSVELDGKGLVATLYLPPGEGPHPGVVVLGGSGGGIGWQRRAAGRLASRGYAALALAYFGMEGLPEHLEEIPLEYFTTAIDRFAATPRVDDRRLAVLGVSKGGELALLLGSIDPRLSAVVAYVPSSAVFQSIAPGFPSTSSWARAGEPLPYVPYRPGPAFQASGQLVDLYAASLDAAGSSSPAVIPAEKIVGPVLLLSGRDDTLWPATRMAEQVMTRLAAAQHPHPFTHHAYEAAGHQIARVPHWPAAPTLRWGGSAGGNARATADGWQKVIAFLDRALRPE